MFAIIINHIVKYLPKRCFLLGNYSKNAAFRISIILLPVQKTYFTKKLHTRGRKIILYN